VLNLEVEASGEVAGEVSAVGGGGFDLGFKPAHRLWFGVVVVGGVGVGGGGGESRRFVERYHHVE